MKSGWYYLNRNGKVEKNDWKTIGKGKYCFDSDGRMRTGWHYENGDIYYLGNGSEGYTRSGWYFLESDGKKRPAEGSVSKDLSGESEKGRWYYFQSNGKARKGEMVLQRKQPLMERNIILTKMVLCLPAGSV